MSQYYGFNNYLEDSSSKINYFFHENNISISLKAYMNY